MKWLMAVATIVVALILLLPSRQLESRPSFATQRDAVPAPSELKKGSSPNTALTANEVRGQRIIVDPKKLSVTAVSRSNASHDSLTGLEPSEKAAMATQELATIRFELPIGFQEQGQPEKYRLAVRSRAGEELSSSESDAIFAGDFAELSLSPGSFEAHAYTKSGRVSRSVGFTVKTDALVIQLPAPKRLRASLRVFDSFEGTQLPGARVTIKSTVESKPSSTSAITGDDGSVLLEDVPAGPVQMTISKASFGEQIVTFALPCRWNSFAIEGKSYDLGEFDLHQQRIVGFELRGSEEWYDAEVPFRICQGASGPQIPFGRDGLADLPVTLDDVILVVKVFFPDGKDSVRYLDGGLPNPGERHVIDLSAATRLDVQLNVAASLTKRLEGYRPVITVSNRDPGGDAVLTACHAPANGSYQFNGIDADEVVVSFDPVLLGGSLENWATKSVTLSPSDTTTCLLHVESAARPIQFRRPDGSPLNGGYIELRRVPDTTTWLTGGPTDEDGSINLPDVGLDPVALRIRWAHPDGKELMGIDLRTGLPSEEEGSTFTLPASVPTSVKLEVAGARVEYTWIQIFGEDSVVPAIDLQLDASGETAEFDLLHGSRGRFAVEAESFWFPDHSWSLAPGANTIRGYQTGHAYFDRETAGAMLGRIRSVAFGRTLAEWKAEGLVVVESVDQVRQRIRIPAGEYALSDASGQSTRVETLAPGGTIEL